MKLLKWILIVLVIIAGLLLIIPAFLPSTAVVTAQTEIALSPEQIFQNVALYSDRPAWDPWLTMEPEAKVSIYPDPDYVGSTYEWEGDKIGNGKMEVDSVHFPDYIGSLITFGKSQDASNIEWMLDETDGGTLVTWSFFSKGSYPFGRIMQVLMKGIMETSFETGLANLKAYIEENPPVMYRVSKVTIESSYATNALVISGSGTTDELVKLMHTKFTALFEEVNNQGLNPNGPPFTHFLDYDEATGFSNVLFGLPVNKPGIPAGEVMPKFYEPVKAVSATLNGNYDYSGKAYDELLKYIAENDSNVTGEVFEVYLKTMMDSPNPLEWETMIAFPLK